MFSASTRRTVLRSGGVQGIRRELSSTCQAGERGALTEMTSRGAGKNTKNGKGDDQNSRHWARTTSTKRGCPTRMERPLLFCDDGISCKGWHYCHHVRRALGEGLHLGFNREETGMSSESSHARGHCFLSEQPLGVCKRHTRFSQRGRTFWRIHSVSNHGTLRSGINRAQRPICVLVRKHT